MVPVSQSFGLIHELTADAQHHYRSGSYNLSTDHQASHQMQLQLYIDHDNCLQTVREHLYIKIESFLSQLVVVS